MTQLNPRERKLVAIGLLVAAIALVWLGVISPIVGGFAQRDAERHELIATIQRNERLLDAIATWRADAEAQRRTAPAFAIVAPSPNQAQDLLDQRVTAAMTDETGHPPGIQDLQTDLPSGWVGARADTQLTLPQLTAGLHKLENEEPYVVVERLSISAEQAFHSGHSAPLDVRLEVAAAFHPSLSERP